MTQRTLIDVGILGLKSNPSRLVSNARTYRHPTVAGLHVTIYPIPSIGTSHFWSQSWYGLHSRYDRVLVEDGHLPQRTGTFPATKSRVLRIAFPMLAHDQTVDSDLEFGKYDTPRIARDRMEGQMAFTSVANRSDPPVDPRARRAVDHLNVIASRMDSESLAGVNHRVAMPWNVYHVYYLQWRLKQEGWIETAAEEVMLIGKAQVAMITLTAAFFSAVFVFAALRFLLGLIFWF